MITFLVTHLPWWAIRMEGGKGQTDFSKEVLA